MSINRKAVAEAEREYSQTPCGECGKCHAVRIEFSDTLVASNHIAALRFDSDACGSFKRYIGVRFNADLSGFLTSGF